MLTKLNNRGCSPNAPAFVINALTASVTNVLSNTRASAQTVTDHEGLWRYAKKNELCWDGLRRVENLIASPTNVTAAAGWTNTQCTVTANNATAPDGTLTAHTAVASGADPYISRLFSPTSPALVAGRRYTVSWYIKGVGSAIGKQAAIYLYGTTGLEGLVTSIITLDGTWQRFGISLQFSGSAVSTAVPCRLDFVESATVGDTVYVWHPQLEELTGASNTAPNGWIDTDTVYNAVAAGVRYRATTAGNSWNTTGVTGTAPIKGFVVEAEGTPISNAWTMLSMPKNDTNYNTYSEDLSNAAWTKLNDTVSDDGTRGPDGRMVLWKVTDTATSGEHRVYQTASTTSTMWCFSVVVKAGTTAYLRLRLSSASDTVYADFDGTTFAVLNQNNTGAGTVRNAWSERIGQTSLYRITVIGTWSAAVTATSSVFMTDALGTTTYSGSSKYYYLGAMHLSQLDSPGPYIPNLTTGTTSRALNSLSTTLSGFDNGRDMAIIATLKPFFNGAATWKNDWYDVVKIGAGTTYVGWFVNKGTAVFRGTKTIAGVDNTSDSDSSAIARLQQCKFGVRLLGLKAKSYLNGVAATENSNTTAISNTSALSFTDPHCGMVRLEVWSKGMSDAEMPARTT